MSLRRSRIPLVRMTGKHPPRCAGLVSAASVSVFGFGVLVASAGTASAAANQACPAGFQTITVEQAVSEGYLTAPVEVDNLGNGDGTVCRRPLGKGLLVVFPNAPVDQIYHWIDNATPR
jgi:hypothetical protein